MDYTKENSACFIDRIKKTCRGFRMTRHKNLQVKVPYNRFIPLEFMKPGKYKIRKQRTLEEFGHE